MILNHPIMFSISSEIFNVLATPDRCFPACNDVTESHKSRDRITDGLSSAGSWTSVTSLPTCLEESRCVSPERADWTEQGLVVVPRVAGLRDQWGYWGLGGHTLYHSYTTTTLSPTHQWRAGGILPATQCTILTITFDWLSITPGY